MVVVRKCINFIAITASDAKEEGMARIYGRMAAPSAHDTPSIQISDVDVPDARVRRTRKQLIRLLMSLHLALAY